MDTRAGVSSFSDLLSEGPKARANNRVAGKVAGSRSAERELPPAPPSQGLEQHHLWVDVSLREGLANAHRRGRCRLRMCNVTGCLYIFRDGFITAARR